MSASEAKPTEIKETRATSRVQNLTDTASFNAFCIVKLSNGQSVSTQLTFRHGITEDEYVEDFRAWYRILDKLAADGEYVEFWNGGKSNPVSPVSSSQPEQPANSNGNGKKEYPNEFKAGLLTFEVHTSKTTGERVAYYKVEAPKGAKFPKFPVTVWPEVLEAAGIVVNEIDPVKGMELTGWTAVYEKNEKGFPGKVIELRQPDFMKD